MYTCDEDKASRLDGILSEYAEQHSGDPESAIKDVLTDLIHVCARDGYSFDDILQSSQMMFEGEVMDLNAGDPLSDDESEGAPSLA